MRGHLQCENGKGLIGLIHAKNVGFEYFRRDSDGEVIEVIPALKDVSMQVQPGRFCSGTRRKWFREIYFCEAFVCTAHAWRRNDFGGRNGHGR